MTRKNRHDKVYLSWPYRVRGVGALDISRIKEADASEPLLTLTFVLGCMGAISTLTLTHLDPPVRYTSIISMAPVESTAISKSLTTFQSKRWDN